MVRGTSTRLLVSQAHEYPGSVCILCDSDLLRVEPYVRHGPIFPSILGELFVRVWLYEDDTPLRIIEFVDSISDYDELKAALEIHACPLRRLSPNSVPRHREVLPSVRLAEHEMAVWDYLSDRITQYLECDGIFPLVTRGADEAVAVAFRFNRSPDRQGTVYDDEKEIIEWSSCLETLGESGRFWGGVDVCGVLPFDTGEGKESQQIGASLGLSLILARERKRATVFGYWPPLDILATGALHSGRLTRVESIPAKLALADRLRVKVAVCPEPQFNVPEIESLVVIPTETPIRKCVELVTRKLDSLSLTRITFHQACLGTNEAGQIELSEILDWRECDVIHTRLLHFQPVFEASSSDAADAFGVSCRTMITAISRRRRYLHHGLLAAIATLCALLTGMGVWLWQEKKNEEIERINRISRLTEQGRQEILQGFPLRSLPYLEKAYSLGGDSGPLKYLLARGLESVVAQISVLGDPPAIVSQASFLPGSTRVMTYTRNGSLGIYDARSGSKLSEIADFVRPEIVPSVSRDGSLIASAKENIGLIWASSGDQPVSRLEGHEFDIKSIAFSPDGTQIVTSSVDDTARVWSVDNAKLTQSLRGHRATVQQAVFDGTGDKVVTLSLDRTIRVWDATSGRILQTIFLDEDELSFQTFPLTRIEVSPDGRYLVGIIGGQLIKVWDLVSADLISEVSSGDRGLYAVSFNVVADTPVAIMAPNERTPLNLVNLISNEDLTFATNEWMTDAVVSRSGGRAITTGFDQSAEVWDMVSGHVLFRLEGHRGSAVTYADFSDDDTLMLTVDWNGTVRVWQAQVGMLTSTVSAHAGKVFSISFNRDGSRFVTAGEDNQLKLWSFKPFSELNSISGLDNPLGTAVSNSDGTVAVSVSELMPFPQRSDTTARIWDLESGNALLALKNGHTNALSKVLIDEATQDLFTVSWTENKVNRWDLQSGEIKNAWFIPTSGTILDVTSVGESRQPVAFTTETSGDVLMWDLSSLKVTASFVGHRLWCQSARLSPSGTRLVTGSGDMNAKVWDVESGAMLFTLEGHKRMVMDAQFSPNESIIVTGGIEEGIMVWDAESGDLLADLRNHGHGLSSFAFHPSGRFLLTANDGYIKCWTVSQTLLKSEEVTDIVESNVPWKLVEDSYLHRKEIIGDSD